MSAFLVAFLVTEIEFDFDGEDFIPAPNKAFMDELISNVRKTVWYVDEEDELVDFISDETGFCIKSINYRKLN